MSNLPLGWGDRHNQMSEHDMALGGAAATKFGGTAKNAYEHDSGNAGYKTSDQVRDFYMKTLQTTTSRTPSGGGGGDATSSDEKGGATTPNVPEFWEERQRERELQAKQMGVFANRAGHEEAAQKRTSSREGGETESDASFSAEVALVQIATHALEKMAMSINRKGKNEGVKIPMADRAAFAKAMKEAMNALAKSA